MASTPSLYRVSIVNRHLPDFRSAAHPWRQRRWWSPSTSGPRSRGFSFPLPPALAAGSRSEDSSAPYEMSVESALKLLGVNKGATFDEILRAKNAVAATCKDDPEATAQIEAAYDTLLMQSLSQRRAGKVASSRIRYADVKPVRRAGSGPTPQWMQKAINNPPVSIVTPTNRDLGIQAGVFGTLMVFTFASGSSALLSGPYTAPDVPGYILATGFGASLYFLAKKNVNLGKAALITIGGLVVGAVIGSTIESWLQVDVVPIFGIRSPAVIVSEFILFSQLVTSLYLR
ncbi:chaperone (DUF3353) [Carex rostrata]